MQDLFFGPERARRTKPDGDVWVSMRVLITVKAAPQPSWLYGETVCVAGLRLDPDDPGWVRLYPVTFRELTADHQFRKYEVVDLRARPARKDPRMESWQPDLSSIHRRGFLRPWGPRRSLVDPYVTGSMCGVLAAVRSDPPGRSLAAVRPRVVEDLVVEPHPGWSPDEQKRVVRYFDQPDLFGSDLAMLEAPSHRGWYRYRCHEAGCRGHRQGVLDWEFVAMQWHLRSRPGKEIVRSLRERFLHEMCGPDREVAFYVGNQAKRPRVFSVLGVYCPKRARAARTRSR